MKNRQYDDSVFGVFLCSPTNSTMFTKCCECAICNYETRCPNCRGLIIGHEYESDHERGVVRWRYAFKK